jgi:Tfp pilus assembly protein PilO
MRMSANNRVVVGVLGLMLLAIAFWMLLVSPKRGEVNKLDHEIAQQRESLSLHQSEVRRGLEARRAFPQQYQQLVVLGKATPADDETASLLVQLNHIAEDSKVRFQTFTLVPASTEAPVAETAPESTSPEASSGSYPSPTEVAASTMPLGASIGPAGLAVMPYTLTFKGDFFHIADFIHGLDSLVKTKNAEVDVTGRLITINSFSLVADPDGGFPNLQGSFSIATYLVPPGQGVTGGATPSSPEPATTPVSTTIGGTP